VGCPHAVVDTAGSHRHVSTGKPQKPEPKPEPKKFPGIDDLVQRVRWLERQVGLRNGVLA
jgi:hypothetical protein